MKKRILSMLLIAVMLLSLCAGCGEKSKITENKLSYKYEQELNVIDDNYRNYYEIFVYSFYDSDGDGIGDLQGVIQKLDYVKELGFNGIWLMPIMPSPSYHKYDVTDYYAIDEAYGTMEDFEKLVDECHKRDINLIIDFVINHSSSEHPWFKEAYAYIKSLKPGEEPDLNKCPYVDYYHFSKKQETTAYTQIPGTEWYYEGAFWSGMPDLNLKNQALRAEIADMAKFWIEKGVDGFRMDAVMHIEKTVEENNEVMNWLYTECTKLNPDFYMVSEVWDSITTFEEYYGSKTPSIFNFHAGQQEGLILKTAKGYNTATEFVDRLMNYAERFSRYNPNYIDAIFMSNHDMGRVAEVTANNIKNIKFGAGLMMTMNGCPFVYYGEEIGMPSTSDKDENKRLPMIWSDTDSTGKTFGPPNANVSLKSSFASVEDQLKDENSILNYYKHAIRLRNENPEIARGEIKKIESLCKGSQAVITKTYNGSTIAIAYNNSDEEIQINIGDSEIASMGIRGYLTLNWEEITLKDGVLTMPARSICILK